MEFVKWNTITTTTTTTDNNNNKNNNNNSNLHFKDLNVNETFNNYPHKQPYSPIIFNIVSFKVLKNIPIHNINNMYTTK